MKILYVIHGLPVGGAETLVVNYLIRLKQLGHEVGLVELRRVDTFLRDKLIENSIPVFSLMNELGLKEIIINKWYPIYWISRLNRIIKSFSPAVVHYHTRFEKMDKISFPANRSFLTFHARLDRLVNKKNFSVETLAILSNGGMTFVGISSTVCADIERMIPGAKIEIIPNGLDIQGIRKTYYDRNDLMRETNIPQDSYIIGQVGRFNKVKNHLFTIGLMPELLKKSPKCNLVFIGTGDEEEVRTLKEEAARLHVENHIVFLGQREDATALMTALDAIILPSFSESFSLVLVEAQAKGIRCVASDNVPEDVICNNNCFRLSLDAPKQQWADFLLGKTTRESCSDIMKFDIEKVIDRHISMYKGCNCLKN